MNHEYFNAPPIARVKFSNTGSWAYDTNGHFFNISGWKKDCTEYHITDPNMGRVDSNSNGKYYVKRAELLKAINDHWAQHFYY